MPISSICHISKIVNMFIFTLGLVPVIKQFSIHMRSVFKRSIAVSNYVGMIKMCIAVDKDFSPVCNIFEFNFLWFSNCLKFFNSLSKCLFVKGFGTIHDFAL